MYLVGHDGNIHLLRPNGRGLGVSNLSCDCGFYCFETKDLFSSLRMVGWVVGQKKGAFFVNVMNRWLLWGNGKWSGAWQTLKTNRIKLTFHPEIYSIFTFWKGSGNNFSITLCVSFSSKMFLCYIYQLTKFHCLIAFTSCKDVIQD